MSKRKIITYNPKLLSLAKKLRKNMTLSEVLLWKELKGKQMHAIEIDGDSPTHEDVTTKDGVRQN